jgi:hypothetical protein
MSVTLISSYIPFHVERCFNMDKNDISTVHASMPKDVTIKGKNPVCKVPCKELGQTWALRIARVYPDCMYCQA